ncbi:YARHG domain-containing protein [Acinetobacter rathckeae]|uniref:YARHG domain-containing protein n=1 Tax=Acinetobacter rathckeae TaxID=2605272 RepID=UPI0018A2DCFF|nr:YARHG domain-containing protein [Acinetobacter rathckeae]MBF7686988.1 YARHG domain-containing protein [Acinetobacter rathckeae]
MKKFSVLMCASVLSTYALASAPTCQKLQDDYNLIYASKGFCFKDPEAIAKYGNDNCYTNKPKFSEREQQRLDQIKEDQKTLNCK